MAEIVQLYDGDERCETLFHALLDVIHERGDGLPLPLIFGTLRILEHHLIQEQQ